MFFIAVEAAEFGRNRREFLVNGEQEEDEESEDEFHTSGGED